MKKNVGLIIFLSILIVLLTIFIEIYAKNIPRWWGWLVGGVDTLAEDGILTSIIALL